MARRLSHLGPKGDARMVNVGLKAETTRRAIAEARVLMKAETLALIMAGEAPKGDVFAAARISGIMAAKRTADLIPLCHPLPLTRVEIDISADGRSALRIEARVETTARTGVEMEALTACTLAALTIYDMAKAVDREMEVTQVRLLEKTGGTKGDYKAAPRRPRPRART